MSLIQKTFHSYEEVERWVAQAKAQSHPKSIQVIVDGVIEEDAGSKWAVVAEEMSRENLLRDGLGERLREQGAQFRQTLMSSTG